MRPPMTSRPSVPPWWLLALVLLPAAVLSIHRPSLDAYLFEDDVGWVLEGRVLTLPTVFAVAGQTHFYRPIVALYFLVFAGWFHGSPILLHALNIGLHVLNALLVFTLARRLGLLGPGALVAGLFMAVLTRSVESVAWISGISAILLTTFALLTHILHLRGMNTGRRLDAALSLACYSAALLTHEAGVALLPLLVLVDWMSRGRSERQNPLGALRSMAVRFFPHVSLTAAYLLISYGVNRSNYVITEGHYQLGWHALDNLSGYLVALYVGRSALWSRILTMIMLIVGLAWGSRPLRLGLIWMLFTLLPYCFFTWGLASRYLYLPGVGFALALGSMVPDPQTRMTSTLLRLTTTLVVMFLACRFAFFGLKTAQDYRSRTLVYRAYVERFLERHPFAKAEGAIEVPAPRGDEPPPRVIQNLLRLACDDPSLQVVVREQKSP